MDDRFRIQESGFKIQALSRGSRVLEFKKFKSLREVGSGGKDRGF